jgi:hypothetical protein
MQDTMMDVVSYWKGLALPLVHVMYDSWWYVKECPPGQPDTWLTCKGAVELWEPRPDVFPGGFSWNISFPLALHNRWFGASNDYITKLGFASSFIVENGTDFALPVKSDVFTYLMGRAKAWGMVLYEQVSWSWRGGAQPARACVLCAPPPAPPICAPLRARRTG